MKKFVGLLVLFIIIAMNPASSSPLSDLPTDHWAQDAVLNLASKGIIEGYPDGTFKGDRSATRYELAMVVARFLAKNDQEHATFATREEIEELRKLVLYLKDELDALGVRVTNLEENVSRLDMRAEELERIRFKGKFEILDVSTTLRWRGSNPTGKAAIYFNKDALFKVFNVIPIESGDAVISRGDIGLSTILSSDLEAGASLTGYNLIGDTMVGSLFGLMPSYLANPFASNIDFNNFGNFNQKMFLDNIWFSNKSHQGKVTIGSFGNSVIPESLLKGQPTVYLLGPDYYPFYGVNVRGAAPGFLGLSELNYEIIGSKMANGDPYTNHLMGAAVSSDFNGGGFRLSYLRDLNENGPRGAAAILTHPEDLPAWVASGATPVGNQQENLMGLDFYYDLFPWLKAKIFLARSVYKREVDAPEVSGDLASYMLEAKISEKLQLSLEYLTVGSTFDPLIIAYPIPPFITDAQIEELFHHQGPYPVVYSRTYQLHDSKNYPSNRKGYRATLNYFLSEDTSFSAYYESLRQNEITSEENLNRVGFYEPFFLLPSATGEGGRSSLLNLELSHTFRRMNDLSLKLQYWSLDMGREGRPDLDRYKRRMGFMMGELRYPLSKKLSMKGGYFLHKMDEDHIGVEIDENTGMEMFTAEKMIYDQNSTWLGLNYSLSEDSELSFKYEMLTHDAKSENTEMNGGPEWDFDARLFSASFTIRF